MWKEQRKDIPSQKHGWHHTHTAAGQDQAPTTSHSHTDTRVPLSSQGCAAGQECRRHRERAQADDPLHFPEDFDPPLLFKLSSRKSSRFTAQTGRGHSKNSWLGKVLAA